MDVKKNNSKSSNNNNSNKDNNNDSINRVCKLNGTTEKSDGPQPTVQILFQNLSSVIPDAEHFARTFPKKVFLVLSILQLLACAMAFNSHIFIIISTKRNFREFGTGIWCGFVFGLSGGFGCFAAHNPSGRKTVAFLVTSIISACFCVPLAALSTFQVIEDRYLYHTYGTEVKIACNFIQVTS